MNTIYHEALQKGREWAAKYAGAVHKSMDVITVDIKPVRLNAENELSDDAKYALKKKRNDAIRLRYQEQSFQENKPKILGTLFSDELMQVKDVAKATRISCQRVLVQARRLEREGIVRVVEMENRWWMGRKDKPKHPRRMAKEAVKQQQREDAERMRLIGEHIDLMNGISKTKTGKDARNWTLANVVVIGELRGRITRERQLLGGILKEMGVGSSTAFAALRRVKVTDPSVKTDKNWKGIWVWREEKAASPSEGWRTAQ